MKETNMEHFRSEIKEILSERDGFSVINGNVNKCVSENCYDCIFSSYKNNHVGDRCGMRRINWLMSEYKPEPVLTAREKGFVEFVQKGWLARDKYKHGGIYYYFDKPTKECATWEVDGCAGVYLDKFGDNLFPFITWEDEEPWAVEDLRKLKVEE